MKLDNQSYSLMQEMFETCDLIRNYVAPDLSAVAADINRLQDVFFTGEGSSRIFPAKSAIFQASYKKTACRLATECSYQGLERDLKDTVVIGASNSGRTKELMLLFQKLAKENHPNLYSITAHADSPLQDLSKGFYVLPCGAENAVAATKSVVCQAMLTNSILAEVPAYKECFSAFKQNQKLAADAAEKVLSTEISAEVVQKLVDAPMIYFAGQNNGAAEELTLKTNEIVRKKSDFLEGTYAFHGIEEVMLKGDCVVFVNPFPSEYNKMKKIFEDEVEGNIIVISSEDTPFTTIKIPEVAGYQPFLQLLAGWNLLVAAGLALGINLDKPRRARKIGNAMGD